MERYCKQQILQDLERKMAFIAGPRQVSKTTLAKNILKNFVHARYFNWDVDEDRKILLNKLQPKRAVQIVGKLKTGQGFTQDNITVINPIDYFTKQVPAPWEK